MAGMAQTQKERAIVEKIMKADPAASMATTSAAAIAFNARFTELLRKNLGTGERTSPLQYAGTR
jgi:hypothetical protein